MSTVLDQPAALVPVVHGDGLPLAVLGRNDLFGQLKETGYAVLRGYQVDLAGFSAYVKQHSSRLSLDPARVFYDAEGKPVAQKVDAGTAAVGLHCENGNSPFWPDLCWFYCERPPTHGSQTTVCDGVAVLGALGAAAREAFLAQDIVYTRRVPEHLWKTYVRYGSGDEGRVDDTAGALQKLLTLVNDGRRAKVELHDDASITYSFQTPAVLCGSAINPSFRAFANSIFGPSYNYERPAITFADGTPLSSALLAETGRVCDQFTYDVGWQAGDVLVIDNRRVMHGRRAIEDEQRSIYNALSYV
jgi:alpha-ketoglutarate-dependent taurine dioxygenase